MRRLKEIEARCNAATEGPWRMTYKDDKYFMSSTFIDRENDGQGVGLFGLDLNVGEERAECYGTDDDGEFIAHAREDIPILLAVAKAAVEWTAATKVWWDRFAGPDSDADLRGIESRLDAAEDGLRDALAALEAD